MFYFVVRQSADRRVKDKFDLQRKAAAGKSFKNIDFAGSGERRRTAILKTSSSSPQILSESVNVRKEILVVMVLRSRGDQRMCRGFEQRMDGFFKQKPLFQIRVEDSLSFHRTS